MGLPKIRNERFLFTQDRSDVNLATTTKSTSEAYTQNYKMFLVKLKLKTFHAWNNNTGECEKCLSVELENKTEFSLLFAGVSPKSSWLNSTLNVLAI